MTSNTHPTVPPIRTFTRREALRYPSSYALHRPDKDGPEDGKERDSNHTITEAIAHLEDLVRRITSLAQPATTLHRPSKKRRPSEDITSRGQRYLASASPPQEKQPRTGRRPPRVAFDVRHQESKSSDGDGNTHDAPTHTHQPEPKSAPAVPIINVTPAIDEASPRETTSVQDAETSVRKQYLKNNPSPPPRRTAPRPPIHRHKSTNLGLPRGLKPDRRDVTPFEDEEWVKHELDTPRAGHERHFTQMFGVRHNSSVFRYDRSQTSDSHMINLKRVNHVDLWNKPDTFDVHASCDHATIARNWPDSRKRFVAAVVCINTSCLGLVTGIYSGEVPAIQYVIADFHHYAILGNVFLYCGLALSNFFLWPLPLLHGRKVYTVAGLTITLGLQIPQGLVVSQYRMPDDVVWRTLLLLSRSLSGVALGMVSINQLATLLDLFGASLQSRHPHGESANPYDVRRHGGGMGLWLAAWSWCTLGTISLGFVIGAFIVDNASVQWGFWTTLCILMFVLILNLLAPEVRRAAFRRSMADLVGLSGPFSRVTRGELKMHLDETGPYWWGEEVHAGVRLCWKMVRQPGFLILASYTAWVFAQFTLILMLFGALCSRYYFFRPLFIGLCALSLAAGALMAVPFQKASFLSRARKNPPRTDSSTFDHNDFWTSHLVRRILFTIILPSGGIAYALTARGPPMPVAIPCLMAAIVGYFSNLALAECFGLIMETFDTSDLQPGMTGRPLRGSTAEATAKLRTEFTCYPRVCAGIAVTQSLSFMLASAATGLGGRMERRIGAMQASGVMAGILMLLTLLLTLVLWRWKTVQMIPSQQVRRSRASSTWEPVVLGEPSGLTRKISILEAGKQTRWAEIRRRNRLETQLTGG